MRSGESNGSVFESSGWGITQAWSDALLPQAAFLTLVLGDSRQSTSLLFKLELSCREQRKPVTGLPGKHKRGNTAKIRDRDVCGNWNPSGPSLNGWIIRILYKHWPVRPTKNVHASANWPKKQLQQLPPVGLPSKVYSDWTGWNFCLKFYILVRIHEI